MFYKKSLRLSVAHCVQVTKNMKRHMELHQQNRMQIPCPICSKVVLKTGMSSHMRTVHSGRKPYKCPHCDYSSAFRGNLNTHIKVSRFGLVGLGCLPHVLLSDNTDMVYTDYCCCFLMTVAPYKQVSHACVLLCS